MKILIINGSPRKNGATAAILNELHNTLITFSDVEIEVIHLSDLKLHFCSGCCVCYKTGTCIFADELEALTQRIKQADGIILGSPTYACNVSAQMKLFIDRGHLVMEQLLKGKYAMSVVTYENYGGSSTTRILKEILLFSGAKISNTITSKTAFNSNPPENPEIQKEIHLKSLKFYRSIQKKRWHLAQHIMHAFIFHFGIKPFVLKKGELYHGVVKHWATQKIT